MCQEILCTYSYLSDLTDLRILFLTVAVCLGRVVSTLTKFCRVYSYFVVSEDIGNVLWNAGLLPSGSSAAEDWHTFIDPTHVQCTVRCSVLISYIMWKCVHHLIWQEDPFCCETQHNNTRSKWLRWISRIVLHLTCPFLHICDWYNFTANRLSHDGVMKWKHFPRYWPFVWGIHRPPVNSPHKGQWRGASSLLVCPQRHSTT